MGQSGGVSRTDRRRHLCRWEGDQTKKNRRPDFCLSLSLCLCLSLSLSLSLSLKSCNGGGIGMVVRVKGKD